MSILPARERTLDLASLFLNRSSLRSPGVLLFAQELLQTLHSLLKHRTSKTTTSQSMKIEISTHFERLVGLLAHSFFLSFSDLMCVHVARAAAARSQSDPPFSRPRLQGRSAFSSFRARVCLVRMGPVYIVMM